MTQALIRSGKSGARARARGRGSQSRVLRIIGGTWRGRRFRFPDVADIRPTPDRVRETLFNWLGIRVSNARCLDAFAGSGALGLEALSRGAKGVLFLERNPAIVRDLRARLAEWGAQGARVEQADAVRFLSGAGEKFDIVFLDPPFTAGVLGDAAARLEEGAWLAPNALIYVECPARDALPRLPESWRLLKSKHAGEVGYHLFERVVTGAASE